MNIRNKRNTFASVLALQAAAFCFATSSLACNFTTQIKVITGASDEEAKYIVHGSGNHTVIAPEKMLNRLARAEKLHESGVLDEYVRERLAGKDKQQTFLDMRARHLGDADVIDSLNEVQALSNNAPVLVARPLQDIYVAALDWLLANASALHNVFQPGNLTNEGHRLAALTSIVGQPLGPNRPGGGNNHLTQDEVDAIHLMVVARVNPAGAGARMAFELGNNAVDLASGNAILAYCRAQAGRTHYGAPGGHADVAFLPLPQVNHQIIPGHPYELERSCAMLIDLDNE